MHVLLSIDPAAKAGAALFIDGKLCGTTEFDGSTFWTCYEALDALLQIPPGDVVSLECIIEEGFVGFRSGKGTLTLARRRGLVQAAAEALGFTEFTFIVPSRWQPAILGPCAPGTTKEASIRRAFECFGIEVGPDIADAVNIGKYYLQYNSTQCVRGSRMEAYGKLRPQKLARKVSKTHPSTGSVPAPRRTRRRKSSVPPDPASAA